MASFLARAVADEIIPPSVLRNAAFLSLGGEIVKGARRLLSRCVGVPIFLLVVLFEGGSDRSSLSFSFSLPPPSSMCFRG